MSRFKHECTDWDFMEIDVDWPEFECCTCFKPFPPIPEGYELAGDDETILVSYLWGYPNAPYWIPTRENGACVKDIPENVWTCQCGKLLRLKLKHKTMIKQRSWQPN